jgi:hypothetical protein
MDQRRQAPHEQVQRPDKPDKHRFSKFVVALVGVVCLLGAIWWGDVRWQLFATGVVFLGVWAVWLAVDR